MSGHFESSKSRARNENLAVAALILIALPLLLYYGQGERNPLILGIVPLAAGILAFLLLSWVHHRRGTQVIDITEEGIHLRNRREDRGLTWAQVKSIRHTDTAGEYWHLIPHSGKGLSIPLDGFHDDQRKRIGELIQGYFQKSRLS